MPSPQQGVPHSQPQVALQPSPSTLLLSSQYSPAAWSRMPSPQPLASLWQMALQPSPGVVLPSSHCSGAQV